MFCTHSSPTLTDCVISNNYAQDKAGGIYFRDSSSGHLETCIIINNEAGAWGGGLMCWSQGTSTVSHCTFYGNSGGYAGGILTGESAHVVVESSILAFNVRGYGIHCLSGGTATLTCCDVFRNVSGDWVGCIASQYGVNGNFWADPFFCDAGAGDFHLRPCSPCLDAPGCGLVGALGEAGSIRVWHVPVDAPTIKAGVDSAAYCDTIVVAAGAYYEHDITMKSGITLRSETGEADCVTINAQQLGRVFYFPYVTNTTVEGFTITGGSVSSSHGGGMLLSYSSPTFKRCIVSDNSVTGSTDDGGGVYCSHSSPILIDCVISGNTAEDKAGGFYCRDGSPATFEDCLFANNSADAWAGGLLCYNNSNPTLTRCTFYGNSCPDAGGISSTDNSHITIENTIVSFSTMGYGVTCDGTSGVTLTCCDVYGNAGGDWVACIAAQEGVNGNFGQDPRLCDPDNGDFGLAEDSPCAAGNHPAGDNCGLIGAREVGCSPGYFELTDFLDPLTAGGLSDLRVTAYTIGGSVDAEYEGTVLFSSSDGLAALPESYTFLPADNGTHLIVSGVSLVTAGVQSISVADSLQELMSGTAEITVLPAALDPDSSLVLADPEEILSDGVSISLLTVIPCDQYCNRIGPGQFVAIAATGGTLLGAVSDEGDGTYIQNLQAAALPGSSIVSASVNSAPLTRSAIVDFVDDIPPEPFFTYSPPENAHLPVDSVSFAWDATDIGTPNDSLRYSYALDGGKKQWSHDTTASYQDLAEGLHTFEVSARDLGENIGAIARHFATDFTAPTSVIVQGPSDGEWANSTTVTFCWVGEDAIASPESLVFSCRMSPDTTWSPFAPQTCSTFVGLAIGDHTFEVRARDVAGNTQWPPTISTFGFDFQPPETWFTSGPPEGQILRANYFTVCAGGEDDLAPTGSLRYSFKLDGGSFSEASEDSCLQFSVVPDGHHTVYVKARDVAGNDDPTPDSLTFFTDVTPPSAEFTTGPDAGEHLAVDSTVFCWQGSDALSPPESLLFAYRLDDEAESPWDTLSCVALHGMSEGHHTFRVRVKDEAGNIGSATRAFGVDFTPPETFVTSGPDDGGWWPTSEVTFTWSGDDSLTPIADLQYSYKLDSDDFTAFTGTTAETYDGLAGGLHTFAVKSRDLAGHEDLSPDTLNFSVGFVDLVVTDLSVPDNAFYDTSIEVIWTVANNGSGPAIGTWSDQVFVSWDGIIGDDELRSAAIRTDSLNSGESYTDTAFVEISFGENDEAWIVLGADGLDSIPEEGAESNNWLISDQPIAVAVPPHANLVVDSVITPPQGLSGQGVEVSWIVTNGGDGAATGSWYDEVCLSADSLVGDDQVLGSALYPDGVEPGESYVRTMPVELPEDISGDYWIVLTTDVLDELEEYLDEDNNTRISTVSFPIQITPFPDLLVTAVGGPDEAVAGGSIDVEWTVENEGEASTNVPVWYDRIYLSPEPYLTATAFDLGQFANPAYLPPGEGYTGSASVTIPAGIAGIYHLVTCTDWDNRVDEHGEEGDNSAASEEVLVRYLSPLLDVTYLRVPPSHSAWSGEFIDVEWAVTNIGDATFTSSHWNDAVALSQDQSLGAGDRYLGESPYHETPLAPGESDTVGTSVRIPVDVSGVWHLFAIPNAGNVDEVPGIPRSDSLTITLSPPPDLVVSSVSTSSDTVDCGDPLLVNWTVTNEATGVTSQPEWVDAVYLSEDEALDIESDQSLLVLDISEYLEAGDSYNRSQAIVAPSSQWGTYHLFVLTDRDDAIFEGPWEDNNSTVYGPVEIVLTPPDLQVSSVQTLGDAWSGQVLNVEWSVFNAGTGTTEPGSWMDRVYLSLDDTLDTDTDVMLGASLHTGVLDPDESVVDTLGVTLPHGVSGQYFIVLHADADSAVAEFAAEENNTGAAPVDIQLTSPPDLQVVGISVPSQAWSGQPLPVEWTVQNLGSGSTRDSLWVDAVYLSPDSVWAGKAVAYLGSIEHDGALEPDSSYLETGEFRVPDGLSGIQYVHVLTDSADQVYEHSGEGNNIAHAVVDIQLTPPPDFQVVHVTVADTVFEGRSTSVQWLVQNLGSGPTPEGSVWTDAVYYSLDDVLDTAADVSLVVSSHSGSEADDSYLEDANAVIPAGDLGTRYLFVVTDASDDVYEHEHEDNNIRAASIVVVQVPPQLPDLALTDLVLPDSLEGGSYAQAEITWTVENVGDYPPPVQQSYWRDALYLSENATLDASDVFMGSFTHRGGLGAGAAYGQEASIRFSDGTAGDFFLIARANYQNRVDETNLGNNVLAVPLHIALQPVDLVVSGVDAPDSAISGQRMTVRWTVSNDGEGTVLSQTWSDFIYLSRDFVIDAADAVLGSRVRSDSLAGGDSYADSVAVTIPLGMSGNYYVFLRTDRNNQVFEDGGERNNQRYDSGPVSVVLAQPADLAVQSVAVPTSGTAGEPIHVTWEVENVGANDAPGQWEDAVYISADTLWDLADPRLGSVEHTGGLAPGKRYKASYEGVLDNDLPGIPLGEYQVIVRTDTRNNVNEATEANNEKLSEDSLAVSVIELTPGIVHDTQISTAEEQYYHVQVEENEDLKLTVECDYAYDDLELYVGYGDVPDRVHYESAFNIAPEAEVIVPGGGEEGCYLMLFGDYVPSTGLASILAESIPFGLQSVSPTTIGDNGRVTLRLYGGGFRDVASVFLRGTETHSASRIELLSSTEAKATFEFANAANASYDVELVCEDSLNTSTLADAIVIEPAAPLQTFVSSEGSRIHFWPRPYTHVFTVRNIGNVDIPYANVAVDVDGTANIEFNGPGLLPCLSDSLPMSLLLHANGATQNSFLWRDLEPGEARSFLATFSGMSLGPTGLAMRVTPTGAEDFALEVLQASESIRAELVSVQDQVDLPETMLGLLTDAAAWQELTLEGLRATGVLDAPGLKIDGFPVPPLPIGSTPAKSACPGPSDGAWCAAGILGGIAGGVLCTNPLTCGLAVAGMAMAYRSCKKMIDTYYDLGCDKAEACRRAGGTPHFDELTQEYSHCEFSRGPIDPNEKQGPEGLEESFVTTRESIPYVVYFENMPDATAAAQEVRVLDQLDDDLDWRKFTLTEFSFGDTVIGVPAGRSFYQTAVDLPSGSILEIDAGIDVLTGQAHWHFNTIDPLTGFPPEDPMGGFLPPNDSTHVGEGHVGFLIETLPDLEPGTEISNSAVIYFDQNDPIETNEVLSVVREAFPDLTISSIGIDVPEDGLLEGVEIGVHATVENVGEIDAPAFDVRFYKGATVSPDSLIGIAHLATGLAAGSQMEVGAPWEATRVLGEHELIAVADADAQIAELDEENNTRLVTIPVAPRRYKVHLAEGPNMIALPVEPAEPYTASSLAAHVGASFIVQHNDSIGQFEAFVPQVLEGEGFEILPRTGYIAVLPEGAGGPVDFEGMTHLPLIHVMPDINMVSLPLEPDSAMMAREYAEHLGADQLIRYDPGEERFVSFIPSFHEGDGFEIQGGVGYIVIAEAETTAVFEGTGWMGEGGVPPLPTKRPDHSERQPASVFAVAGHAYEVGEHRLLPVSGDCQIIVTNRTMGKSVVCPVNRQTGGYAVAFVDLNGSGGISIGDELEIVLVDKSDEELGGAEQYVVTPKDIKRGYSEVNAEWLAPPAFSMLENCYPNPFNPVTTIKYQIAKPGKVTLKIYNVEGRLVRSLVDETAKPGYYRVIWWGKNENGYDVASGVYFCRMEAPGFKRTTKMILTR